MDDDVRAVEQLKYRYLRTLDTKDWAAFADTLTEDVAATYGARLDLTGRDAVVDYMRSSLGPEIITVHVCHHPEITVDGDRATGSWALEDTVIATPYQLLLRGASYYADEYRREDDGAWRIASTRYRRLYEATISLADLPSWNLLEPRAQQLTPTPAPPPAPR